MPTLTVLTVSTLEPYAWRFIRAGRDLAGRLGAEHVLAMDVGAWEPSRRDAAMLAGEAHGPGTRSIFVDSDGAGFLEACLNQALARCETQYVLRIDDDERVSRMLEKWLAQWIGCSRPSPQYTFPRAVMWPDANHYVDQAPWWPDPQARLATVDLSRRYYVHELWRGEETYVPWPIEHYQMLVKTPEQHEATKAVYARERPDAGYSLPDSTTRTAPYA